METLFQPKIFILDDDQYFAKYLCTNLRTKYPETKDFSDEKECLTAFNQSPDILILDHKLKHQSGFDFMRSLRLTYPSRIAIIYLSSEKQGHIAVRAIKHGAIECLDKGECSLQMLFQTIDRITEHTKFFQQEFNPSSYWQQIA